MPSEPSLQQQAGVYQLTWKDENVVIRVDRIHTEKAGVYGEILIRTTAPGFQPHLHGPVHFNLIATTSRRQLVSHLNDLLPVDWAGVLEQACYIVVEQHREGTPAVHIADHQMPEGLAMRIEPILQENQATLFFGEGDSLKSFFATYLAVLVQTGTAAPALNPVLGNVMYLDYETDVDTFWERVDMLTSGLDMPIPEGMFYRPMVQPLVAEFPRVNDLVMENDIKLVIVDSAAPATVEPENAERVTAFFTALRSLNTTSLVIAHMTKTAKGDYPFGSTFWRNLPRSNFQVKADRTGNDVAISLRHTKSNNGKRLPLQGFQFAFDGNSVMVTTAKPGDHPNLAEDMPLRQQMQNILGRGAMTLDELDKLIEKPRTHIISELNRRSSGNPFTQVSPGKWGLALSGNE